MRFTLSLLILIFCSCGSDNIGDCFESQGDPVEVSYELPPFTKLRSESDVIVYLKQGPVQKVVLKTGENMLSDAQIEVLEGGILRLKNNKRCNLVRDYENFIVYVTTPNLTEIRNASGQDIIGEGVLEFSTLRLVSDTSFDAEGDPARKSGNFYLELATDNLTVQANGKSVFYLSGSAESFRANFPNEGPRLESRELIAQDIVISQTSANKMIVNPQASIKGTIFGTGDVISANRPPIVEVEQLYTGRLIFEE